MTYEEAADASLHFHRDSIGLSEVECAAIGEVIFIKHSEPFTFDSIKQSGAMDILSASRSRTDCVPRIGRTIQDLWWATCAGLYWSILTSPQAHFR
jgi:hypothetical protein